MGHKEKRAYLEAIRHRYQRARRQEKSKILDEFCAVCGYNRKYAIRVLKRPHRRKKRNKPGRLPLYSGERLLKPLQTIWLASDQLCSKKLKVALREWLAHYEAEQGLLDDVTRGQLNAISPATIDRLLKPLRVTYPGKGRCGTKPGRLLKNHIPVKTDHWDVTRPGYVEADTVAHCGNSLAGDFAWTITLTDIQTAWTENRAIWNKGAQGVVKQVRHIEKKLPFEILGFDCDNGSEFLNDHLIRYFTKRKKPVQFTRSRPYHKNDNAHVEQKNWTHVRQLLGYDRLDNPGIVDRMNDLYSNEWSLYQNHFCPTMKLIEKKKINSRYYKRYDAPKAPYQRMLESKHMSQMVKKQLQAQHQALNPFELKRAIEQKLKAIFAQVKLSTHVRHRL
jgi:hypothetical protein